VQPSSWHTVMCATASDASEGATAIVADDDADESCCLWRSLSLECSACAATVSGAAAAAAATQRHPNDHSCGSRRKL